MSTNIRTRDGTEFNFVDGLKVKGVDIGTTTLEPVITDLNTTTTDNNVTVTSSTGADAVIPAATSTTAGVMSAADKVKLSGINLTAKQDTLVSGTNIKTINGESILGSGNIDIVVDVGASDASSVTFEPVGNLAATNVQAAVVELDTEKQPTLVSGTNIKTINNLSILGSGNIDIASGAATAASVTFTPTGNISATNVQLALVELDSEKQSTLVSGTSIKTINSSSLLGTGDVVLQAPLVSGTTIKTINTNSLLGSGNLSVQDTLVSGTNIKTINNASILGSGNISISGGAVTATDVSFTPSGGLSSTNVQAAIVELDSEKQSTLVSGTTIKTINSLSILGSGNIDIASGATSASGVSFTPVGNISSNTVQEAVSELDNEKQSTLVSGTNIKTINGESILGSGDIVVDVGASDASSVTFAPVGDLQATDVQAAIEELDSEKQPTLVSGTSIKTINGTSLLGSGNLSIVGGEVVNKIKIAVIGASLEAQANLLQETWPTKLQRSLIAFGQDCVVYNLAVIGYTFDDALWTNTFGNGYATATPVDMAISLGVDVVIVDLGANDTLTSDTTPVQDVKDNALALFTALKTGLPNAKIIYASLLAFNATHRPDGIGCLNRDITNYGMNLRTSGFLSDSYSSLILDDPISSNMSQRLQNWIEVDNYIKSLTTVVDGWFTFDLYKCARLGLVGEDTVHLTAEGSNMFCSWALQAFNNVGALADVAPMIRSINYAGFDDADYVFSLFCYDDGTKWLDNDQNVITNHISTNALMLRGIRPRAWAYPSKASFFTGLDTIDKNGIAVWGVENAKPNTVVELCTDEGLWSTAPFYTTAQGTVIVAQSHGHILDGSHNFYARIGNEVFGPYSITKLPAEGSGGGEGSSVLWAIYTSSSSQNPVPEQFNEVHSWSFVSGTNDLANIYVNDGVYFQLPVGVWYISVSIGVTLPPYTSCYVKFAESFIGASASSVLTTGSAHNPTAVAAYGVVAGSGIIVSYGAELFACGIIGSSGMNLNADGHTHRITIHRLESTVPI